MLPLLIALCDLSGLVSRDQLLDVTDPLPHPLALIGISDQDALICIFHRLTL